MNQCEIAGEERRSSAGFGTRSAPRRILYFQEGLKKLPFWRIFAVAHFFS